MVSQTILVFVFTLFGFNQLTVAAPSSCSNYVMMREFVSALNKDLRLVSYWEKITRSPVICVSYCHSDPNCQSVNYHTSSHLCQLNNVTRAQYPDDFNTLYGSLYFDGNEDTIFESVPSQDMTKQPTKPLSTDQATQTNTAFKTVTNKATKLLPQLDKTSPSLPLQNTSCQKLLEAGIVDSGVYTIYPDGFSDGLEVYCDMETDGGGWIVIQRRQDGSVDFNRNWAEYRDGFGDLSGEFWFGNENISMVAGSTEPWQLRVDLENMAGEKAPSVYSDFKLKGGDYQFYVGLPHENIAGDALSQKTWTPFSTRDVVNVYLWNECQPTGGWWILKCPESTLNSPYVDMKWNTWEVTQGNPHPLKSCSMKIRIQT